MRAWMRNGLELLGIVFLMPQVFALCYHFDFFFKAGNPLGMLKAVALYGLSISWVSAPFLVLASVLVKILVGTRVRWYLTLLVSVGAGYLWVAAWNLLVFATFTYGRATLPIILCGVGSTGYALARKVYEEALPPLRETKNEAADLPE